MVTGSDERSRLGDFAQGYGPLIAALLAIVLAMLFLPMLNAVAQAPAVVSDDDLARLRALPAAPGSVESDRPAFVRGGRGRFVSPCARDEWLDGLAQFVHLPRSQLRRLEYTRITDCRLSLS